MPRHYTLCLLFLVAVRFCNGQIEGNWKLTSIRVITPTRDRQSPINDKRDNEKLHFKKANRYVRSYFKPLLPSDTTPVSFQYAFKVEDVDGKGRNKYRKEALTYKDKTGREREVRYKRTKEKGTYSLNFAGDSICFRTEKETSCYAFQSQDSTMKLSTDVNDVLAVPATYIAIYNRVKRKSR